MIFFLCLYILPFSYQHCHDDTYHQQCQCSVGDAFRHVQAGGVKAHFYGVLSGRNIHCAQDIVGACQFGRLSVDGYVPAVRIIDFGEYGNTVLGIVCFVRQAVRCVTCQADAGEAVFITFRGALDRKSVV